VRSGVVRLTAKSPRSEDSKNGAVEKLPSHFRATTLEAVRGSGTTEVAFGLIFPSMEIWEGVNGRCHTRSFAVRHSISSPSSSNSSFLSANSLKLTVPK